MSLSTALEILLVEDDPGMALLASERLTETKNWNVTTALSAAQCRTQVDERAFDVVLLDRGLPDCDGGALIPELLAKRSDMAIVMLTGSDSAHSATETLRMGAWDYVVKRPDIEYLDELPGVIRRCAERLEWKREETRLRAEVDLLLTAMRTEADSVVVIDNDTRVRFWNAAAEHLFGWRSDEVLTKPLPLIPPDRQEEFARLGERARQGQPLVGVEIVLQRRDGSRVEVSLTLTAVANPDGTIRAYVGVLRDISERKKLERDRADFAAMLTHDIKNPVMIIRGYASILADATLTEEQKECAAGIERAADMINALVTNFLTSATIEAGTLKLERERVSVVQLIGTCVQQFQAAAARVKVNLTVGDIADTLFINGDHSQLERALNNLVGNAIKYTPGGGSVIVDAVHEGGQVVLRVEDTGPGIEAEELPHVFERYRRERGTRRIDGAGLGLFIVRSLADAHGGSVGATSEPGKGSRFTIRLPLG